MRVHPVRAGRSHRRCFTPDHTQLFGRGRLSAATKRCAPSPASLPCRMLPFKRIDAPAALSDPHPLSGRPVTQRLDAGRVSYRAGAGGLRRERAGTSCMPHMHGSFRKVYERKDMGSWEQRSRKARAVLQAGGVMAKIMAAGAHMHGVTGGMQSRDPPGGGRGLAVDGGVGGAASLGRGCCSGQARGAALRVGGVGGAAAADRGACEAWAGLAVQPGVRGGRQLLAWAAERGVRVMDSVHDPYATFVLAERQVRARSAHARHVTAGASHRQSSS